MNENLNLVDILKDCPRGTKLYYTVYGEVEFDHIANSSKYPIILKLKGREWYESLTSEGKGDIEHDGECLLFPSREQRDWSKFKPTCEFKDGDILSYQNVGLSNRTIYIYRYHERFNTTYYVALSGDVNKTFRIDNKGGWALNGYNDTARFATEEEKQKLFKAIKDNGYEWNAGTKTLKKLVKPKHKFKVGDKIVNRVNMYMGDLSPQSVISEITEDKYILNDGGYIYFKDQDIWELAPNKFDPKTLRPYDRVLVRYDSEKGRWRCTLFSHIIEDEKIPFRFVTSNNSYEYCIPYNEDTKHLVGTSDEAPEYYRYWED